MIEIVDVGFLSGRANNVRKVFWDNPYQSSLLTKVSRVHDNDVLFESTIAYISAYLPEILSFYDDIIERDLPIEKGYSDVLNQRRFWKIDGFAQVPCGGTHVNTTREVGYVKLKREHPGKYVERIEIRPVDDTPLVSK